MWKVLQKAALVFFLCSSPSFLLGWSEKLIRNPVDNIIDNITLANGVSFNLPSELPIVDNQVSNLVHSAQSYNSDIDTFFVAKIAYRFKTLLEVDIRPTPKSEQRAGQTHIASLTEDDLKGFFELLKNNNIKFSKQLNRKVLSFKGERIEKNGHLFIATYMTAEYDKTDLGQGVYQTSQHQFIYYNYENSFIMTNYGLVGLNGELEKLSDTILNSLSLPW